MESKKKNVGTMMMRKIVKEILQQCLHNHMTVLFDNWT